MSNEDTATRIIADAAKDALTRISQRCTQAVTALEQQDHLVALGAIIGLEKEVHSVNARLLVLREIFEAQKQKPQTKEKYEPIEESNSTGINGKSARSDRSN